MTSNEPRPASLHVYLGYRDAPAVLDWLRRAFGFETTMQFPDEQGGIAHAEMRFGDAAFVVFSDRDGYDHPGPKGDTVGVGTYLAVADRGAVDAVYARAIAAGGTGVWEPEPTEWENYRCRVRDLEGREWTFGTHVPGEPTVDWSDD